MMVVTQKAEEKFRQKLEDCWLENTKQRCVYLRMSRLLAPRAEWMPVLVHALQDTLAGDDAEIYVCHDNDVFILTRHIRQKLVERLLTHLTPKLNSPALSSPGLASLFEVILERASLETLSSRKYELYLESIKPVAEEKAQAVQKISREQTLGNIDPALIASIASRRTNRAFPEIMIVEDDMFSQRLVNNALAKEYTITMTADGQGAVLNYATRAPDVLFLDIGLPDIDGLEVLEKIFAMDKNAYVVMFSANGHRQNIMKAIELGARGFVAKPFTREKLFHYIEKSPFIRQKILQKQGEGTWKS